MNPQYCNVHSQPLLKWDGVRTVCSGWLLFVVPTCTINSDTARELSGPIKASLGPGCKGEGGRNTMLAGIFDHSLISKLDAPPHDEYNISLNLKSSLWATSNVEHMKELILQFQEFSFVIASISVQSILT